MPKNEEEIVRCALVEKRLKDLENWRKAEQKRSVRIFYSVIATVLSTVGYIISKIAEKVL